MKKLILFACFAFFSLVISAQGKFSAGVTAALPIGDSADFTTFAIAVDLGYLFELSEDFDAGISSGYTNAFGEDPFDDFQFVPIAGSIYFNASESVSVGGDVGYAVNVGTGGGGDFYFRPVFVYNIDEDNSVTADFRSVSGDGVTFSWLGLGYRRSF